MPGANREPARSPVLDEQRRRWQAGDCVRVEALLAAHPALTAHPDAVLDVIYGEVVLREQRGESPRLEEYLRRFPNVAEALRRQFAVHEALRSGPRRGPVMDSTPVSLIVRLRRPADADAWERFVRLFTPLLDQWARRLGLEGPDAEDLIQDVFAVLVRRLPDFAYDPQKSFRAWLWTVLYHARQRRHHPAGPLLPPDALDNLAPAAEPPPFDEEEYRRHVVGRAVQVMRTDFAAPTWQAFWGLVVEGKPAAEVARDLGLSVNAVYLAKARVLTRLRQELAGLLA